MPFSATSDITALLGAALAGSYMVASEDGSLRMIIAPLRGSAVAAAAVVGEQLVVIVDIAKPHAHAQARALLAGSGWRLLGLPEGTVVPVPEPTGPTPLRIAEPASPHRGRPQLQLLPPAVGGRSGRRWS